ncbi:hypothetical protein U9M48_023142, partial [Paspalum notatum var. saurae]
AVPYPMKFQLLRWGLGTEGWQGFNSLLATFKLQPRVLFV